MIAALLLAAAVHKAPPHDYAKDFFVVPSISYAEAIGGGLGFGYQHPKTRVFLSLSATYTYSEDVSGSISRTINCRRYTFPYQNSGDGKLGVAFSVAIPFKK